MLNRPAMAVSLNEVEALSAKAVRGAGAGWGIADDIARATRWMAERQLDWSGALVALLGAAPVSHRLAPVFQIADLLVAARQGDRLRLERCEPIWALAILSASLHGGALVLDLAWPEGGARLLPDGRVGLRPTVCAIETFGPLVIDITTAAETADIGTPLLVTTSRRPVPRGAWDILEDYAARTYVAATAASRTTGAGGARVDGD